MAKIIGVEKPLPDVVVGTATPVFADMFSPTGKKAEQSERFRLLDELWDMGLRMYDCSALYGETSIGEYLTARGRRNEAIITTKCCHPNQYRKRVKPFDMESDLYDSLAKLNTDYIDIYLLHRDDPEEPVEWIIDLLNRFHREGKIGAFGGSNWTVKRISEANAYAEASGQIPFTVSSPNYSLAHQVEDPWGGGCTTLTGPEHAADRQWYIENDMPVLAYSSMARGFFAGKFKGSEPDKAQEILDSFAKKGFFYPENMERLTRAEALAEKYGCRPADIALGWLFHQKLTVFPIISGSKSDYFKQAAAAKRIPITPQEVAWLDLEDAAET